MRTIYLVCVVSIAPAIAPPASATVLLPTDFSTVVGEAHVIVHARVIDVRSTVTGSRRTIESFVTVAVIGSLKGDPGRTVTFRVPGGQVGRYRRVLVGAPEFVAGQELVLFLAGRTPAMPTVVGFSQGVYRVRRSASSHAIVMPPPIMSRSVSAERIVRGDPARRPMSLDAFAREVDAALKGLP